MITRLENLSRLRLSDSEREEIKASLTSLVGMFGRIREVDTDGVEPLMSLAGVSNITREDKAENTLTPEQALSGAPGVSGPYFSVPKVIE